MARKLLTTEDFRSSAKDGETPDAMVVRASIAPVESIAGTRRKKFVFSDGSVDRAGDTIDQAGWMLDSFNMNPIALFGHDSGNVDSVIGRAVNVGTIGQKLIGEIDFAEAEVNPRADMTFRMVEAGLLSAVSVGFLPVDYSFTSDKSRPYGIDFKKQELLEISVVPVPMNANALVQARGLGIDTGPLAEWAQRILDGEGKVPVPRDLLEQIFKAAKSPLALRQKYLAPETRAETSDWRVGAARDLPMEESDSWDGPAAAARMFAAAGFDGDSPDAAKARRGFLVYDAANPALKGSYKLPFADIVGGELKAVDGGLRAAASRLTQTDAPKSALDEARGALDVYEARDAAEKAARSVTRSGRQISAANAEILREAIVHHQTGIDRIKTVLAGELPPDDTSSDDGNEGDPADILPDSVLEPVDGTKDAARVARLRKADALKRQIASL